jgi:hypothetical protein
MKKVCGDLNYFGIEGEIRRIIKDRHDGIREHAADPLSFCIFFSACDENITPLLNSPCDIARGRLWGTGP